MKNKSKILKKIKEQQASIVKEKSFHHAVVPSIEELQKYAHTKVGASYLKARLLFEEGKKEFFSGHERRGIELIGKGYWEDEKACPFSDDEGNSILKFCWEMVKQESTDVKLHNSCALTIAFMYPSMEPKMMVFSMLIQDGSFRAISLMGSWLASAGKWSDALMAFRQAYEIDPTEAENYYAIAIVYKQLGDISNARKWFERYIQESGVIDFKRPAAHYEVAMLDIADGKINDAIQQAKLARITLAQRIPYLPPLSTSSQMMVESMLGLMYDTNTLPQNANKISEKVRMENKPKQEVPTASKKALELKEKGNQLFEKKEYEEAIKYYEKALEEGKSSIDAILYSNISVSFSKLENYEKSLLHAEKSIICDPYFSKGYARKAFALMKLNRIEQARTCAIISNALGMKIIKGHELFSLIPESQIVLVRHAHELKPSIFQENVTQSVFLVITDEDSYHITTEITRPCTIIGIGRNKPKFSKLFDCIFVISSPECYFENIHFSETRAQLIYVNKKGTLIANKCEFCSSNNPMPLVACGEGGKLTLQHCLIHGAQHSGGVMVHDSGSVLKMSDCKVHSCSKAALEVITQARAEVDNCEFFGCGQGIIGYNNGKSITVRNSRVYQNAKEGVLIANKCSAIFSKVSIFKNNHFGLSVDNTGSAKLNECDISDNVFYGISIKGDCPFEMTDSIVSGNQCGGIRIGINYTSPIKLSECKIINNYGPGIHNETDKFKSPQEKKNFINQMKQLGLHNSSGKIFNETAALFTDSFNMTITNVIQEGNDITTHDLTQSENDEHKCSFCSTVSEKYFRCSKCKQTVYCGGSCQKKDWPKHKIFCNSIAENNTVLIDASKSTPSGKLVRDKKLSSKYVKRQDEKKGKYLDGEEFVVKIQTLELDNSPDQLLTLYDESRELVLTFSNRDIYYLIMKCGTLGEKQMTSKKIFLKAKFNKATNQLSLFTHKVLPLRQW